ncbi:hypothetical protein SOVF_083290 [Spinacia oleracea]|nr:hypothetical protein SOVF_083290 [Spinacia oleracea]
MESDDDVERRGAVVEDGGGITKISHMWDDSDVEWKTWLIPIFVGINVVFFLVTLFINNCPSHNNGGGGGGGGGVRIGIIYLIAGIGGNIASCLFYPTHISVGPSCALLGLIGAMFSELLTNWTLYVNKVAAVFTLSFMFVINLLLTLVPHPHNAGPIGGFAVGFLLGFILLPRPHIGWFTRRFPSSVSSKTKFKPYQYALGITSLALLIIGYIIGLVMLFRG